MTRNLFAALIALTVSLAGSSAWATGNAHAFSFTSIEGGPLPLAQFEGNVLLVVNTASFCGFTHQYADLQAVWDRYRDRGLVVLGIPSNDFGGQEPGTAEEIKTFCEYFAVDFPLADKTPVRGKAAHPFYEWARKELGAGAAPKWNFHKYLVDAEGNLVGWFPTEVSPSSSDVIAAIEAELDRGGARSRTGSLQ